MAPKVEPDVQNEASNEVRRQSLKADRTRKVLRRSPLFTLEQELGEAVVRHKGLLASET